MSNEKTPPKKIEFHNIVSEGFREMHVDGAHGGLTPKGHINLSFYAERFPIPKSNVLTLDEDKGVYMDAGVGEDSKEGIIRRYEFGVFMDLKTATEIYNFIGSKIAELESLTQPQND